MSEDVQQHTTDIKQLDSRTTTTDKKVNVLEKDVGKNTKDIVTVKKDVKKQGEKIEEIKEVVDETVEKVEDLDHKVRLIIKKEKQLSIGCITRTPDQEIRVYFTNVIWKLIRHLLVRIFKLSLLQP